ncbi:MAG TPA: hypothetical protein VFD35_10385 [Pricia sp.]|nr:hypothetical protein [Pricia sp.]
MARVQAVTAIGPLGLADLDGRSFIPVSALPDIDIYLLRLYRGRSRNRNNG